MKAIGFYELRSFSNINKNVKSELKKIFPDYELIIMDIFDLVRENKLTIIINIVYSFFEYLPDLIYGKKKLKDGFIRNSYMFRKIRKIALRESVINKFEFTFQTQSVFDASTPGIPHFVFTDNTILANLDNPHYNRNILPSRRWLKYEKSIYQNAAIVFTMSTNITRSLERDYNIAKDKIKCVYAGSNIHLNGAMTKERNYDKRNILFVGGNWYRKGGPVLIEAFKKILKIYPDTHLHIISRRAPQMDIPNCHVHGKLNIEEVGKYYENSSVFCLPTILEPFGIVFLEAMMYSLPVVTTNISAIPDFITNGENGYLVEPNNVDQLTQALLKILESADRRRSFGQKGFNIYKDKYAWDIVISKIKKHIDDYLSKTNPVTELEGLMVNKEGILISPQSSSQNKI